MKITKCIYAGSGNKSVLKKINVLYLFKPFFVFRPIQSVVRLLFENRIIRNITKIYTNNIICMRDYIRIKSKKKKTYQLSQKKITITSIEYIKRKVTVSIWTKEKK